MTDKLNERQQLFAQEYIIDHNAEQAAIRAGYSSLYARGNAYKLLAHSGIAAEIQKRKREISENLEITQERVIRELAAIGFAQYTDFVSVSEGQVNVKDTGQLTQAQKAAIASIRKTAHGIEVKLHDKPGALTKLCEIFGFTGQKDSGFNGVEDLAPLAEMLKDG